MPDPRCSCTLRWWLSRWNYKLAGGWAWLPAGTFAANMLGTALDFALQVGARARLRTGIGVQCVACSRGVQCVVREDIDLGFRV